MTERKLTFRFSGKMARLLGRESVSSDVAALFELVKNSYDADAERVKISFNNFQNVDQKNARIVIEDDGNGMTVDELESKWMIIGTDIKEREQRSPRKKRRVIGNKGVGRFSTERLCRNLKLISKPRGTNDLITLSINWDDYEDADITFNDIGNTMTITKKEDNESGAMLVLENLREIWTKEKIDKLRMSLGSLMMPPELSSFVNDKFSVEIIAPDFPSEISGPIQSSLLKYAPFTITAKIDDGKSEYKVTIKQEKKVILEELVSLDGIVMKNAGLWRPFGPCRLAIYFFPGKSRYEDWDSYYDKALHIKNIRNTLENFHGVKVYRDGFWVRPYGDTGDDWLNLEEERVQANYKLGNSQVIGFVQISRESNRMILDTTTRERLVENDEFHSMRTFVKESIDVMNEYRRVLNKKYRENEAKKIHRNIIESEVKHFRNMIDSSDSLAAEDKKKFKSALKEISRTFTQYEHETEEDIEELEISQRAYRNLASLGISSATTAHEIKQAIGHLGEIPKTILNKLKKEARIRNLIDDDINDALDRINTIRYFMSFVIDFVQSLAYDSEIKHEKERINVKERMNNFFRYFSGIVKTHNLEVNWKLSPDNLKIYMNKADFESIILNLFSNSIKALQKIPKDTKRKIKITITKDTKNFKIKFSDNGPGIKEVNRDKIFRLFFTTNKQSTGLGLPIIKEIVDDYAGTVTLSEESELDDGATFLVTIPLETLEK